MTLKEALNRSRESLAAQNIEDSNLEGELLLRHTLGISRVELYLNLNRKLTPKQEETFLVLIKRRLNSEPTAYITGSREFYGLSFHVDRRVLIPRPETELLVEEALGLAQNYPQPAVADIGTGCGAIAISLALNLPQAKIYATDISGSALEVARLNCQKHGVSHRIELLQGNLLEPLPEPVQLMVANLPYVAQPELARISQLNSEPPAALDGGPDGLDRIRTLINQLGDKLSPNGSLLLEVGLGQAKMVTTLLKHRFPDAKIETISDLSSIERVVKLYPGITR